MRRSPTSLGADDEAGAAELAALVDVVDVAADRQSAVGSLLDEAGDECLCAPVPPFGKGRAR